MPSFAIDAVVPESADALHVALNARLEFVAGAPSDTLYALKGRVPDDVDVILQSDLVITLCGILDRGHVSARTIQNSAIAQHLLNYFHANGEQLGLRIASGLFIDQEDGNTKLSLNSTRPILERYSASVRLCAIRLLYVCRTPLGAHGQYTAFGVRDTSAVPDPFSPHAFLPLCAALDRILDKFVGLHLVRHYPLIFGPWRERFDLEMIVCAKIAHAVTDIVARSPHTAFRKMCRRKLKGLSNIDMAARSSSTAELRTKLSDAAGAKADVLDDLPIDEDTPNNTADNHDILCRAMERLFKHSLRPLPYKGAISVLHGKFPGTTAVDDEFQLSEYQPDLLLASPAGLATHGLDARDRIELQFDEDAETVGGSQDEDILFDDESDQDNADIWVADEAESVLYPSLPVKDFADLWDSSQSTLDDSDMAIEESFPSPLASANVSLSDPGPRIFALEGNPIYCDLLADDAYEECFSENSDQCDSTRHNGHDINLSLESNAYSHPTSKVCAGGKTTALGQRSRSHLNENRQASRSGHSEYSIATALLPCRPQGLASHDRFSQAHPCVDGSLLSDSNSVTSELPILFDDDLACDVDILGDSSGAFSTLSGWTRAPPTGAGRTIEHQSRFDVHAAGSSDENWLSSLHRSDSPALTTYGNFRGTPVRSAPSLAEDVCSVSACSARRAIDGDEWDTQHQGGQDGGSRGGAHECNEGGLVAGDSGHATAIRSGLGTACVKRGPGALAEPLGWECEGEFEVDNAECNEMLAFE